jgi:hypothetical protein
MVVACGWPAAVKCGQEVREEEATGSAVRLLVKERSAAWLLGEERSAACFLREELPAAWLVVVRVAEANCF